MLCIKQPPSLLSLVLLVRDLAHLSQTLTRPSKTVLQLQDFDL